MLSLSAVKAHLVYPQQKRDSKRPEHLLVEMCHCDQHLIFLIYVYLVQRYFLGTQLNTGSRVKHLVQTTHLNSDLLLR